MLKKKLCKRCWNSTDYGWTEHDEICWKKEEAWCPMICLEEGEVVRKITEQPPDECPFLIEHILTKDD